MGAKARTPEGDRRDVLATLIEDHERHHFPKELPDAVEAIKFRMEQQGLTLAMIQRRHAGIGIPAESLLRQALHLLGLHGSGQCAAHSSPNRPGSA